MYIAFHCDDKMGDIAFVSAPSYKGPFTKVGERIQAETKRPAGFGVSC